MKLILVALTLTVIYQLIKTFAGSPEPAKPRIEPEADGVIKKLLRARKRAKKQKRAAGAPVVEKDITHRGRLVQKDSENPSRQSGR